MENPTYSFKETNLVLSSYKNRKLKVKMWWVGTREGKKRAFFATFILSEENFFKICVISQCIEYWMHFQNIHTFTYQKTLLYTLLLLVLYYYFVKYWGGTFFISRWGIYLKNIVPAMPGSRVNVTANLCRNGCIILISCIVPSCSLSLFGSQISSP